MLRLSNEETNRITKECIQSALILLMGEMPFHKITITEIVRRSGVSRTAFYRNFSSKEDVLSDLSEQLLSGFTQMVMTAIHEDNPEGLYCQMFQLVKDNHQEFGLMVKAGLQRNEYLNVSAYIEAQYTNLDIMTRYAILGWWGALLNIVLDWYQKGMKEEIGAMADLCCQLFPKTQRIQKENET